MIVKLLGVLDIASAILLFLGSFLDFTNKILWIAACYLILKGLIFVFSIDFASIIDIACGGLIILLIFFSLPKLVVLIGALFLVQKGIFSLLS